MTLEDYVKSDDYKEEVAVVHLVNPQTGKRIKLVGAVHIGSREYYEKVKRELEGSDAVLYERIIPSHGNKGLRDRFMLSNGWRLGDFYREVAQRITGYHYRRLSKAAELLAKKEPDKINIFNEYKDRWMEELGLIMQGDAIDYENLPPNWYNADMSHQELTKTIGIFSLTNLLFGLFNLVSSSALKYPWVMDQIIERIITKGIISDRINRDPTLKVDRLREAKVYERIDILENQENVNMIDVFYGVAHLPYLEAELTKRGYVRQDMTYLEAIRKKPKDWERMDRKKTKP